MTAPWLDVALASLAGVHAEAVQTDCPAPTPQAVALAEADAPRAVALALMGDGLPAKWNANQEAVEIRDLDPAKARKLAEDHHWIFKGPDFTPSEWKKMRVKDAAAKVS